MKYLYHISTAHQGRMMYKCHFTYFDSQTIMTCLLTGTSKTMKPCLSVYMTLHLGTDVLVDLVWLEKSCNQAKREIFNVMFGLWFFLLKFLDQMNLHTTIKWKHHDNCPQFIKFHTRCRHTAWWYFSRPCEVSCCIVFFKIIAISIFRRMLLFFFSELSRKLSLIL